MGQGSCVSAGASGKAVCVIWGKATSDFIAISPGSGAVQRLGAAPGSKIALHRLSRDEKAVYYVKVDDGGQTLVRWEIARGHTIVLDRLDKTFGAWLDVSPDGRWLLRSIEGRLEIKPVSGGRWTPVLAPMRGGFDVTPDGKWIYFHGAAPYGAPGLYRVATIGGRPERLGDFPAQSFSGTLRISPDSRQVIASVFDSSKGFEFWSLENFVPAEAKP